jgi:hypothetical protein
LEIGDWIEGRTPNIEHGGAGVRTRMRMTMTMRTENTGNMDTLEGNEAESNITRALVDRVSQRRAVGMPLRIALAGEHVTCEEYEAHLSEHPELAELEDEAKRKLLERAMGVLLDGKEAAANFRWLIELVYADVIGQGDEGEPKEEKGLVAGVTEEELEEARRYAASIPPAPSRYD